MAGRADIQDLDRRGQGRGPQTSLAAALALAFLAFPSAQLKAQQSPITVIAPGEAAVTGFAGAPPPPQIAPGDDPAALTFIDASGPSLRIVDLRHMGGRAAAQLVGAPKPFTVRPRRSARGSASRSTTRRPRTSTWQRVLLWAADRRPPQAPMDASSTSGEAPRTRPSCRASGDRGAAPARSGRSTGRARVSACSPM